jgi:hypothetical protein
MLLPKPPQSRPPLTRQPGGGGTISLSGLSAEQGGPGFVIHDYRERGFWGRITGQGGGNKYAYVWADSNQPDEFPQFPPVPLAASQETPQPARAGDGVKLAAYEVTGRTDVPTDGSAIVWLEPLQSSIPGYGFTYTAAAAGGESGAVRLLAGVSLLSGTPNPVLTLDLPAAGTYLVTVAVAGRLKATYTGGDEGATYLAAFLRVGPASYVDGSAMILAQPPASGEYGYGCASIRTEYAAEGPVTLELHVEPVAVGAIDVTSYDVATVLSDEGVSQFGSTTLRYERTG